MPESTISRDLDPEVMRKSMKRVKATFLPEPEPRQGWCPIISADDHVLEPPDLFDRLMPAKFRDQAPHVIYEDYDGDEVPYWVIDDAKLPMWPGDGAVGRPSAEWGLAPQRFDDFRPVVANVDARIRDLDLNGTWASLCFSSFNFGFAGTRFVRFRDRAVGFAAFRAYNHWMIEEWAGAYPDRIIPCQMSWLADPE